MYTRAEADGPENGPTDPHSIESRIQQGYFDLGASPQMKVGAEGKPRFRSWLKGYLEGNASISLTDAIAAGAELAGVDITTVERWVIPMVSILPSAPLEKYRDGTAWMLRLKAQTTRESHDGNGVPARRRPPKPARGNGSPAPHANGQPGGAENGNGDGAT